MKTPPPTTELSIASDRNAAPTLSCVVAAMVMDPGIEEESTKPALESPTLVPPVLFVTGATTFSPGTVTIDEVMTPNALICCPIPKLPSLVPCVY